MCAEKPEKWPVNNRELKIDRIDKNLKNFMKQPNYINREKLLSLISIIDLNSNKGIGPVRITDYEIGMLNNFYFVGKGMNLTPLVSYVYLHVKAATQIYRMAVNIGLSNNLNINFKGLITSILLFNQIYLEFKELKKSSFTDVLIKIISKLFYQSSEKEKEDIACAVNNMLLDISQMTNKSLFGIVEFKFEEIKKIVNCVININNKLGHNPNERPLSVVMKLMIPNFILNSRNENYDIELYKYLPDTAVNNAIENNEIWMRDTKELNDKREGILFKEIFKDKKWINYKWAKKIDLNLKNESYVSSFSKSRPTEELEKRYGKNYFGYKTDRVSYLIAPFYNLAEDHLFFSSVSVLAYDIVYSQEEAKKELISLFEIIEVFKISDKEKTAFLNDIIRYWELSFKDKKWKNENERRYQIFIDKDNTNYYETQFKKGFLKIKSTLFIYPDFISKNNLQHKIIEKKKSYRDAYLSAEENIFCKDCLYSDYSNIFGDSTNICSVCGSTNVIRKNHTRKF